MKNVTLKPLGQRAIPEPCGKTKISFKIAVEYNPYNDTWDVGWKEDDGDFTPYFCGYATQEEAEAEIPGFDERIEQEMKAMRQEHEAEEREQNEHHPNLAYVRSRIEKLRDNGNPRDWVKAVDASDKIIHLLNRDLAEHIRWPLPSWKAIKSGRVYGR